MTELIWKGNIFEQREVDNFVCLTQMAKIFNKRVNDWTRYDSSTAYIEAVSEETGIHVSQLLVSLKGNSGNFEQGTWAHPLVAIAFAQWLAPAFHVWCNIHIKLLMEEAAEPVKPMSPAEMIIAQGKALLKLEQAQARIEAIAIGANTKVDKLQIEHDTFKSEILSLQNIVKDIQAGVPIQNKRNILVEFMQKLGGIISIKEGIPIDVAMRKGWAALSIKMRNSVYKFDLNARYSNLKSSYEANLKAWEKNGKPRGKKPSSVSRPLFLEKEGKLDSALECCLLIANDLTP